MAETGGPNAGSQPSATLSQNAILAAMMDDLGNERLEELAVDDGGRRRHPEQMSVRAPGPSRNFTNTSKPGAFEDQVASAWHAAIKGGAFEDSDAHGVRHLDSIAGGGLHRQGGGRGSFPPSRIPNRPYQPMQPVVTFRGPRIMRPPPPGMGQYEVSPLGGLLPPNMPTRLYDPSQHRAQVQVSPKATSQPLMPTKEVNNSDLPESGTLNTELELVDAPAGIESFLQGFDSLFRQEGFQETFVNGDILSTTVIVALEQRSGQPEDKLVVVCALMKEGRLIVKDLRSLGLVAQHAKTVYLSWGKDNREDVTFATHKVARDCETLVKYHRKRLAGSKAPVFSQDEATAQVNLETSADDQGSNTSTVKEQQLLNFDSDRTRTGASTPRYGTVAPPSPTARSILDLSDGDMDWPNGDQEISMDTTAPTPMPTGTDLINFSGNSDVERDQVMQTVSLWNDFNTLKFDSPNSPRALSPEKGQTFGGQQISPWQLLPSFDDVPLSNSAPQHSIQANVGAKSTEQPPTCGESPVVKVESQTENEQDDGLNIMASLANSQFGRAPKSGIMDREVVQALFNPENMQTSLPNQVSEAVTQVVSEIPDSELSTLRIFVSALEEIREAVGDTASKTSRQEVALTCLLKRASFQALSLDDKKRALGAMVSKIGKPRELSNENHKKDAVIKMALDDFLKLRPSQAPCPREIDCFNNYVKSGHKAPLLAPSMSVDNASGEIHKDNEQHSAPKDDPVLKRLNGIWEVAKRDTQKDHDQFEKNFESSISTFNKVFARTVLAQEQNDRPAQRTTPTGLAASVHAKKSPLQEISAPAALDAMNKARRNPPTTSQSSKGLGLSRWASDLPKCASPVLEVKKVVREETKEEIEDIKEETKEDIIEEKSFDLADTKDIKVESDDDMSKLTIAVRGKWTFRDD